MAGKEETLSPLMEPESKSVGSEAMGGCGMKRKVEETKEASAVDVVEVAQSERMVLMRQDFEELEDVVDENEDPEVIFARIRAKFEARLRESGEEETYEDDSEEFDSDEEAETIYAKAKAKFEAHTQKLKALFPDQIYGEYFLEEDSHDDDKDELGDVVDEAIPA